MNTGFTWLFALDSRYPNTIVPAQAFRKKQVMGSCVWYVLEMFARMEYYRLLVKDEMPHVKFHSVALEDIVEKAGSVNLLNELGFQTEPNSVKIPEKQNVRKQTFFNESNKVHLKEVIDELWSDPATLAKGFYNDGKRLGNPVGSLT